jgi:hypothetical protein
MPLTVSQVGEKTHRRIRCYSSRERPSQERRKADWPETLCSMPLKGPIGEPTGPSANGLSEPSRLASTRGREGGRRDEQPGPRETSSNPGNRARIDGRKLQPGCRVTCDLR